MITEQQKKLLIDYQDRAFVNSILCENSSSYYSFLKNLFNVPLILCSSIISIVNSSDITTDNLKYINIIVNATTAFILSMVGNLKFQERSSNFKSQGIKFNKLVHQIEDNLYNDADGITTETIRNYISSYDNINENIEYGFPYHIKEKIKKLYKDERTLPNILNCQRTPKLQSFNSSSSQFVIPLREDNC